MLATELTHALRHGEIDAIDPAIVAFQFDVMLRTANTSLRLGDLTVSDKIRSVVDKILALEEDRNSSTA